MLPRPVLPALPPRGGRWWGLVTLFRFHVPEPLRPLFFGNGRQHGQTEEGFCLVDCLNGTIKNIRDINKSKTDGQSAQESKENGLHGFGLTGDSGKGECSMTLTAFVFTSFVKFVSLIWRNTLS